MPFNLSLAEREGAGLKRTLPVIERVDGRRLYVDGEQYLNFAGNDYLGLSRAPELLAAAEQAARHYGVGAVASPLVVGHQAIHRELEAELCDWLGLEAVMLFSSGFSANQAVIKALLGKEHSLWQDRLNHASLQEAGLLSPARMVRFGHNDMNALEAKLKPAAGLIVSEGVFSMDGDTAPWPELVRLARASNNWLMIDDAHGLGVLGREGRGTLDEQGLAPNSVNIFMGTFGKALGVSGAFVGGSRALVEYLHNFGRSYIYSTHLPPPQAAAVLAGVHLVRQADDRRAHLRDLVARFRAGVAGLPLQLLPSATAIQPLVVGEETATLKLADALKQQGLWIGAIRPPTVPKGSARLRITLSAAHTRADVQRLIDALHSAL
ncbi:8-amino-7-oxononanoate synthase [Oceanimonas sp. MB9]|uniref:8-amino-7-oxononanoate synthase n=1 Tax=Oceanimonas sp. MB9 TaxID=2588453 RepID=UPI0013F67A69|nr:8-amino-7-oxononanoate synthase [Oceanimonas sp. MB9]NHI01880.1 8-amino-7-oxononanoate synthase [Oceanimonas sp. MB9]